MLKREYLERMGYKYLKNGIYKKQWYSQAIILDSVKHTGYIKVENIYTQKEIDEIQLAFNVLNKDLKQLNNYNERHDLYDLFKTHSDEVLVKQLKVFNSLLEIEPNNQSTKNHITVIERLMKERNIDERLY